LEYFMKFESLSLAEPLLRSLQAQGYEEATPIQEQAIPQVLKGRDIIGCAQTGTGKTAAFSLPTLQQLMISDDEPTGAARRRQRSGRRPIRSLVLTPTRELAAQIGESMATYGQFTDLKHTVIFGGVRQGPQVRALQSGIDILVATPGRLLDLIGQGFVDLKDVEILILDEADQMLDMGFIHDLRKIVAKVPARRQTLMFSATMPKSIRQLASQWLNRPFEVHVAPVASTPELVEQAVYFVEKRNKSATLTHFLNETRRSKTLVFSRTKRGADKIARCLERDGIRAMAIHGNKSQNKRQAVIREFNSKRPPVLVATDLASRGLDFSDISHVINYDMPDAPETYVHRIGRTARAGASGQAVSFCGHDERQQLRRIERLTGQAVPVEKMAGMPDDGGASEASTGTGSAPAAGRSRQGSSRGGSSRPAKRYSRSTRKGSSSSASNSGSTGPAKGSTEPINSSPKPKKRRPGKGARNKKKELARVATTS
jgi:ATP-dependent RNA helicase RhlE